MLTGRGSVRVQRAKTQASDEAETTKTRSGVRDVKLLGTALAALQAQKCYTFMKGGVVFENYVPPKRGPVISRYGMASGYR